MDNKLSVGNSVGDAQIVIFEALDRFVHVGNSSGVKDIVMEMACFMGHAFRRALENLPPGTPSTDEILQSLLEASSFRSPRCDKGHRLVFVEACQFGHVCVVEHFLKHGYAVEQCDSREIERRLALDVGLQKAVQYDHLALVTRLLEVGADIHAMDNWCLRRAAKDGRAEICRALLDAGADVHARHDEPLRSAVRNNHPPVVSMLLEARPTGPISPRI